MYNCCKALQGTLCFSLLSKACSDSSLECFSLEVEPHFFLHLSLHLSLVYSSNIQLSLKCKWYLLIGKLQEGYLVFNLRMHLDQGHRRNTLLLKGQSSHFILSSSSINKLLAMTYASINS